MSPPSRTGSAERPREAPGAAACEHPARGPLPSVPPSSYPLLASRHSVGEVPVACLNACENAEGRGQPSLAATYATELPLAIRVFARSIRRALAYRPMLCPVSRENAEHRCERLTNSMLASSSRPGARPSSSMRSMAACASRASPDRSCAEAPQRAASSPAHDAASACSSLKQVTLREGWRFSFADCSLPATMYVKDDNGMYTEYTGGFPTPKTDTYYTEKLTPKAFAVIYHDGNNQKAAKLYKRVGVPKPGDIFDGVKVDAVKESIEESEDLFAESESESDRLTSVGVADDGIQPLNMSGWFNGCSNLVNVDLGRLDTSQVSNMSYVFDTCENLTSAGISSISGWNTMNVTNMMCMFLGCKSLTSLDLSKWNTENVTFLNNMFGTCPNLTSLNLSGWNTKQVNLTGSGVSHLFEKCDKLDSITLGQNWSLNLYECGIGTSVKFYDRDTGEEYNPKNAITKIAVYTTTKPATVSQSFIEQVVKDAASADVSSGVAPRKFVDVGPIGDQASNAVVNDDASSVVMPSSEDTRHVDDTLVGESDSGSPADNTDVADAADQDDWHKAIGRG